MYNIIKFVIVIKCEELLFQGENYMEQNIGILFVAIGLLSASIGILEKNYMFGVDSYVDKFNKKYNVNIDKATYCRFEGIQRIKTAMRLLILEVVYFLFEIKDLKMMIIMIVIYLIIDLILYHVKRTKFIKEVKAQY